MSELKPPEGYRLYTVDTSIEGRASIMFVLEEELREDWHSQGEILDAAGNDLRQPLFITRTFEGYLERTTDTSAKVEIEHALKALQPFNDAFMEASKWVMPHAQYSEHTAETLLTGCTNNVTLNDFKNAARACKAIAALSPRSGNNWHMTGTINDEAIQPLDVNDAVVASVLAHGGKVVVAPRSDAVELVRELKLALAQSDKLIEKAQDIMRSNIVPNGVSNKDAINDYIRLLDNAYQRDVQRGTTDALTNAEQWLKKQEQPNPTARGSKGIVQNKHACKLMNLQEEQPND